jgi:hypothetical protein
MENGPRNDALDFVKGALVIAMLIYHCLNYFVEGYPILYSYVCFVTYGYIFLSGFVCGTIYYAKYQRDSRYVYRRAVVRAFKLIGLFLIINLGAGVVLGRYHLNNLEAMRLMVEDYSLILLKGAPNLTSFEILIPIAYVLLVSPWVLHLEKFRYTLGFGLLTSFLVVSVLGNSVGDNLYCVLIGIGGTLSGLILNSVEQKIPYRILEYVCVSLLILTYLFFIPLGLNVRGNIFIVFAYVCIVLANLYSAGNSVQNNKVMQQVRRLGRYSLLLYVAQVIMLRALAHIMGVKWEGVGQEFWGVVAAGTLLMVAVGYIIEKWRAKSVLVDRAYRLVFA